MEEEGGGFFRTGSAAATPSKQQGQGGGPRENPITPLTCKQISRAEQLPTGVINIDGREMHMVTVVGQVVEKDDQSTVIVMTIDDGTGVIDVRKWVDAPEDGADADQADDAITVGMYVRVYGDLRTYQGNLIIISTRILLIQDYNEITYNLLLSITAHLNNTRGPIPQLTVAADGTATLGNGTGAAGAGAAAAAAGTMGMGMAGGSYAGAVGGGALSMYSSRDAMGGFGSNGSAFPTRDHENIYNILKTSGVESGLSVQDLYFKLDKSVDIETIKDCIRYLIDEGHIYTANDEDHYLAE